MDAQSEADAAACRAAVHEEHRLERVAAEAKPWKYILGLDAGLFIVLGLELLLRPTHATEMHKALSAAVGAGPSAIPHDDTSILYIRLLGALILSLAALPIQAIAIANDAAGSTYANAHGVWRIVLAVGLTVVLVLGSEQARIVVPFLLHSLWVGTSLSLSGGGPVGAYSALRSLAGGRTRLQGAAEGAAPGT